MDRIEDIWDKGNEQLAQNESLSSDAVLNSISESSIGITSRLPKTLWFGVVTVSLAAILFVYNLFFYAANLSVFIPVIVCLLASIWIIIFLLSQIRVIKGMDTLDLNLHDILVYKIKYLNTRFKLALHCVSLSIVLATFTINLTMENSDGIFELRKILILSAFYLFVYIILSGLLRITHKVYDAQLKNALFNLEENTLKSIDSELKKHKRIGRIILVISIVMVLAGIVALLLFKY